MKQGITAGCANRLAIGLAKSRRITYEQAKQFLGTLTLRIVLAEGVCLRAAAQAALLTSLNTAHRAFLGGVEVQIPDGIPLRIPLAGMTTLNQALAITGHSQVHLQEPTHTLYIGPAPAFAKEDDVCVYCDSWRGGVSDFALPVDFNVADHDDFALGGIMAGAMGVHRCFVRAAQLPANRLELESGISLWNPCEDWRQPVIGRRLQNLPNRFWMLGLGHLGQAFIWNLALMPHPRPQEVEFLLHDFDVIDTSNHGSGLLCGAESVGTKKTRHTAAWLECLGFKTVLTERHFSSADRCGENEPHIAFCGFDRAAPRLHIDTAKFGLVIECGLGATLADFDQADIYVFPSERHTAARLWGKLNDRVPNVDDGVAKLFGAENEVCGALAFDIAGKSVSTSFVGAMAGALSVAELLRTFNRGIRFDDITFDARSRENWRFIVAASELKASQIASMGYSSL